MLRRILPWFFLASALPALAVQTCPSGNVLSTPTADFTDNGDGTVTHSKTGLTWQRCLVGQTWDGSGSTCTGSASTMTWSAALQAAAGSSFASHSDWRLPNVKELSSILEKGCYWPGINATLFPNTPGNIPGNVTWSSTSNAWELNHAWVVSFYFGGVGDGLNKTNSYYVRLVRGGQLLGPFDQQASYAPNAYSFTNQSNVTASATITSTGVTLAGLTTPTGISVSNGSYAVNGGSYSTAPGVVNNGDVITLRHTASAATSTTVTTTVTIGGVAGSFASTTAAAGDTTPPALSAVGVSGTTTTGTTLAATSDETATGYWVVLPSAAGAPSVTQVKASQDGSGTAASFAGNAAMVATVAKTFSISGLAASTAYKLYFVARDTAGNDTTLQTVSFSTSAAADTTPPVLSAVGVSGTTATGTTLAATSDEAATGYWVVLPSVAGAPSVAQVKAGQDGGGAAASFAGNAAMVATVAKTFSISGLAASTAYKLYFVARDTAGNDTTLQTVSFSTSAAVTVPGAPTGVSASAGNGQATVSFTAPASNGGSAILGYTVVSNPAGGVDAQADTTGTSHTVTGLTNGTAYTFTVTARNTAGSSSASSASSGVTPSAPVVYAPPADPAPAPTPAPTDVNVGAGALTISGGLPVRIGSGSVGAALTMNSAAPVTFTLNGSDISVQATVGSVLTVKQISVGGKDVLVLALTQGSVSLTATQAGQALLALGDMLLQAGSAGTVISAGSGQVAVSSGSLILAGNAFAALKDGTLYAGEVAKLNAAGKISSIRLGSADGSGTLAGDALALSGQATGLTLQAVITRLGGKVGRLPDGLEKAVATALGGSGAQNASGTLVVAGSPPRHLLPLGDITVDTDVADGASITADGLTRAAKNGVVVTLAPAPRDLNQFAKDLAQAVPGATLTLRDGGVLVLRLSGRDYVLRPAAEVGSSNAMAGDQATFASSEGVLRYRDGQGGQQALYPAFLDYPATLSLLESLASGVSAAANADGSISVKLGADRFTLIPDPALAPLGAKNITHVLGGQKWWLGEDGRVYLNGSGGVQGVDIK